MLVERLRCTIGGLLVGLAFLLPMSDSAVACGRSHSRYILVANARAAKPITLAGHHHVVARPRSTSPAAVPVRRDTPIAKTMTSVRDPSAREAWPSGSNLELASRLPSFQPCGHSGGCGCCNGNGGCCGMACCVAVLPVSASYWSAIHRHAWAERPLQLSEAATPDTLFRPPCSNG
jgi:hypothetical protein